jgi:hypothetical protein
MALLSGFTSVSEDGHTVAHTLQTCYNDPGPPADEDGDGVPDDGEDDSFVPYCLNWYGVWVRRV